MKRKNAFTLIELLAVIVVLAIIALIATPIVTKTIKNAKKGSAEVSIQNYIRAVELTISNSELNKKYIPDGTYDIDSDGNLTGTGLPDGKLEIDASGDKPTSGTIVIKSGQVTTDSKMTIGDYDVAYNPTSKSYEATEKGNTNMYTNGEVVYFNITTGEKCTSSDYTETQSNTGVKEGCMKFYAFNDDGKDTVNLILDHNTTATVPWISKADYVEAGGTESNFGNFGKNDKGPLTVLKQLKNDTSSWKGTITPSNYTMDQTGETSNAKYTIDYSSYKARLITAQEIATITGNTSWNEKVAANSNWYYFDSKTDTESDICKTGNTAGCSYGWLYDRSSIDCTVYGCLNNADSSMTGVGYWTASSRAATSSNAWNVHYYTVGDNPYVSYLGNFGVRPVIEVLKSKLS